jgi:cardiolipin synthase
VNRSRRWVPGNRVQLLEGGEEFFPRVFEAIRGARHEVLIETFILFEDKVGLALHEVLVETAKRGVVVHLTVDGYGAPDLSPDFVSGLTSVGVKLHVFDPKPKIFGYRTNLFRRMHRKLVIIDGERAFVGGINYSADHLLDYGPEAKLDHAVEVHGPVARHIQRFARSVLGIQDPPRHRFWHRAEGRARSDVEATPPAGDSEVMFVTRDNREHRNDIERHYRIALRAARKRAWIANAYFFPGFRLLHQMRRAARRGVDVRVVVQGQPDMAVVKFGASMLYHHLLRAGVKVYEYTERPMHSKIALTDYEWATVGSSNLDPLSLSLNLEANVIIRDRDFNAALADRLCALMDSACDEVCQEKLNEPRLWVAIRNFFVFHLLRRFPAWAGWLPAHTPKLAEARDRLPDGTEPWHEARDAVAAETRHEPARASPAEQRHAA